MTFILGLGESVGGGVQATDMIAVTSVCLHLGGHPNLQFTTVWHLLHCSHVCCMYPRIEENNIIWKYEEKNHWTRLPRNQLFGGVVEVHFPTTFLSDFYLFSLFKSHPRDVFPGPLSREYKFRALISSHKRREEEWAEGADVSWLF